MHGFIGSIGLFVIVVFLRSIFFQIMMLQATTNMHNKMTEKVLRANILFFDSNPIGRVTTRFSRDMTILDSAIAPLTVMVTQGLLRTVSVIISVSIVNPYLLIFAAIGLVCMIKVYRDGITAMIDAQRLD